VEVSDKTVVLENGVREFAAKSFFRTLNTLRMYHEGEEYKKKNKKIEELRIYLFKNESRVSAQKQHIHNTSSTLIKKEKVRVWKA
jgi:hypothetical protein